MAELKVSGRMTVKRLKENFKNEFGGTLRVYDGREKADENATLASIRRNNEAKGGELVCSGNRTVGKFEREMKNVFGIKVQVATPDDWTLVLDGITLAKLKSIPEKCSKADMESMIAYKRGTKDVETIETDLTGDGNESDEHTEDCLADEETNQTLIEKFRETFIVETEDEVYYDAEWADEETKEWFINNIKAQLVEDDIKLFESLKWEGADAFVDYLVNDPDEMSLASIIATAAYCTRWGIKIDDDTRVVEDFQLYYFNDCIDFHYEEELDIDLG